MSNKLKVNEAAAISAEVAKGISPGKLMVIAVLYFICPLDFDFVPVLGWLDDLAFLGYAGYNLFKAHELTNTTSDK